MLQNKYVFQGLLLLCSFFGFSASAQYYSKDILNTKQLNEQFQTLKKGQIKIIKVSSFEDNDEPSEGFFCEKKFNKNYSQSEMISRSYITGESLLTSDYDGEGRIIKTTNTTPTITNTTTFAYDAGGNLVTIIASSFSDRDSSKETESRDYTYENGRPAKLIRKKNNTVISTITFKIDEQGNVIEENPAGSSRDVKYYYYYDEKNRLTDIVHYNQAAKKLLPDYVYEYGADDLVRQMMSVDESGRNYFIWRYAYTDTNLPEIEKCYSKEKRLLGTIQYDYK